MKLDFKLDFLYYQKQQILDDIDEQFLKNKPDIRKFKEYISKSNIENILELLVFSYSKEYANETHWSTRFIGNIDNIPTYPEELNPYVDIYLEEKNIKVHNLKKVIFKLHDDADLNATFIDWLLIEFTDSLSFSHLESTIKKGLTKVSFDSSEQDNSIIFTPKEGAISKITITKNSFKMEINQKKWKIYRGL